MANEYAPVLTVTTPTPIRVHRRARHPQPAVCIICGHDDDDRRTSLVSPSTRVRHHLRA